MLKKTERSTAGKLPRGIRNNNPLNIRKNVIRWKGLRDFPTDESFCEFKKMSFGFRAAYKTMITYYTKYDCKTLRKIITRWAPPTENDTESYIYSVKLYAGLRVSDQMLPDPRNKMAIPIWKDIIMAMAIVENGMLAKIYQVDLDKGVKMVFS